MTNFGYGKRVILTQEGLVELGNGIRLQDDNVRKLFPELFFIELNRYAERWSGKYVHTIQLTCLYNMFPNDWLNTRKSGPDLLSGMDW